MTPNPNAPTTGAPNVHTLTFRLRNERRGRKRVFGVELRPRRSRCGTYARRKAPRFQSGIKISRRRNPRADLVKTYPDIAIGPGK